MRTPWWTTLALAALLGCTPTGGGGDADAGGLARDMRVDGADASPEPDGGAPDHDAAALDPDAGPEPDGDRRPDDGVLDAAEPDAAPDPDASVVDPDAAPPADGGPTPDMALEPDAGLPVGEGCSGPAPNPGSPVERDGRWVRVPAFWSMHVEPRPVTVYLPPDYDPDRGQPYEVMYLHDGQNLFDDREAFTIEWQVDETVDALAAAGTIQPLIVVGIGNTRDRIAEYTPSAVEAYEGSGQAAAYGRFVVDELKPWIDSRFNTSCATLDTGVGGSSLGGLVSLYLWRTYPDVFGRVAALSPSLWWNDREAVAWGPDLAGERVPGHRAWIDAGNFEGNDPDGDGLRSVAADAEELVRGLAEAGMATPESVALRIEAGGLHNEAAWARRLGDVMAFLWGPAINGAPDALAGGPLRGPLVPGTSAPIRVDAVWPATTVTLLPEWVALENRTPAIIDLADATATGRAPGEARVSAEALGAAGEVVFEVVADGQTVIEVQVPPGTPEDDVIYVAGSDAGLGGVWQPDGLALDPIGDGRWSAVLPLEPGTVFEFKITRGTWETVEKGPNGEELPNRVAIVDGVPVRAAVASWRDWWE